MKGPFLNNLHRTNTEQHLHQFKYRVKPACHRLEFSDPLFKRLFLLAKIGKFTTEEYEQYQKSLTDMGYYGNIINTAVEEAEKRGREVGRAEGKAKGKAEGRAEGKAEAIRTMIAAGIPVETVAAALGMTVEECKGL